MIRVSGLTQHYGIRPVLRDVSIEVVQGEIVAVMGPNGSGKSTLLAAVGGVLAPQKGTVEIGGKVRRRTPEEELAIRREAVYLPDQPWFPEARTGREWLLAVGRLYDLPDERLLDHLDRLLDLFQLTEKADWPISACSTGQKKKLSLCSALITEAPVLILDEPFSGGLDPSGLLAMKSVLQHFAGRRERTVLMATPVPELVEEVAGRVIVLAGGRILAFGTPDELRRQTGCEGSLEEVYEQLTNPRTLDNIRRYFEGTPAA